ncbi:MAG: hypothetical protein EBU32_10915 [Opitutaceae bacterium]|nr:hypothetical protein [Opitutaceae bacterium]
MSRSMPIKLSGELVEEARSSSKLFNRSMTGQIEHWAAIGRAIESQLTGDALVSLLERMGGTMKIGRAAEAGQRQEIAAVLTEFLGQTGDEGAWLREISARGVPLYGSEPGEAGTITRLNPDGSREAIRQSTAAD